MSEDYTSLKQKADELRKAQKYNEAIPFYKNLWENYQEKCNEWDIWGYAQCLYKEQKYKESLEISRAGYKKYPDFVQIKNLYAWNIFHTEIKKEKVDNEEVFFKAANAIVELSNQDDKYSPYVVTCFKVIDYLSDKPNYNPEKISEWLDKLNPDTLSVEVRKIKTPENKERELASDKEKWYKTKSDVLLAQEKYEECIELSEKALRLFSKFHHGNDIWFKRNIALAKTGLKQYNEALKLFNEIYAIKSEWFIEKEIAEVYMSMQKYDEALKYAAIGALNLGEPKSKVKLYELLINLLKIKNLKEKIPTHIELIYSIRQKEGWKIENRIELLAKEFSVNVNLIRDVSEIIKELKPYWITLRFSGQKELSGKIKTILPNGQAGFIECDDKNSYYFKTKDFIGRKENIRVGQAVNFYLEDSFNRKKNQMTKVAVNIRPIK